MRLYADLTDEQLSAEISEYSGAIKKIALGGGIAVVAGEGRRVEYASGNVGEARTALRDLLAEARIRGLSIADGGGAIPVEIG